MTTTNENNPFEEKNEETDQNQRPQVPPPYQKGEQQETKGYKILGINLAVFAFYTLSAIGISGGEGAFTALIIAGIHFVICIIMAIAARRAVWFLCGLLIIIIGFGTCVSNFSLGGMH